MSFPHLIVVAVIALIVLGPEKLPQVARMAGKFMAEFRRITGDFRSTIEGEMRDLEQEAAQRELRQRYPDRTPYDHEKMQEAAIQTALAAGGTVAAPDTAPASTELKAVQAEAATASGKSGNGEPTPA